MREEERKPSPWHAQAQPRSLVPAQASKCQRLGHHNPHGHAFTWAPGSFRKVYSSQQAHLAQDGRALLPSRPPTTFLLGRNLGGPAARMALPSGSTLSHAHGGDESLSLPKARCWLSGKPVQDCKALTPGVVGGVERKPAPAQRQGVCQGSWEHEKLGRKHSQGPVSGGRSPPCPAICHAALHCHTCSRHAIQACLLTPSLVCPGLTQ